MSRPEDNDKRQIIVDLSFEGEESVNGLTTKAYYEEEPFPLTLPYLDYLIVIQGIMHSEWELKIMKIDIARTFRNICIDSVDVLKLGICHEDKYYIDKSLAFGVVHGTAIYQKITDVIRVILKTEGITVWNYIDSLFACSKKYRFTFVSLIEELGLQINKDKVVEPMDFMTCTGIEVDARCMVVSLTT